MEKELIEELSQLDKSEKLILVEALWDSIASDPNEVEIPEHHKSIITERLKTLEQDKKRGSSWENVRQKYLWIIVPKTLILTEKAQEDLEDAYQWYEEQEPGLGKDFIKSVDIKIAEIKSNPFHHQTVQNDNIRRTLTNKFPFSIYFENEEVLITIFAIIHQRRSPESWKSRI